MQTIIFLHYSYTKYSEYIKLKAVKENQNCKILIMTKQPSSSDTLPSYIYDIYCFAVE